MGIMKTSSSSHSKILLSAIVFIFFALSSIFFSLYILFNEIDDFEERSLEDLKTFEKYSEEAWKLISNATREKRAVYRIKLPPRNQNSYAARYVTIPPRYAVPEVGGMSPPIVCPEGPPGRQGHPGHPGDDGTDGQPGSPGGVGLSLTVKLPYNGCIQCPVGPPGEPGRPGSIGHPGENGMVGMAGSPGARGQPGLPGIMGDTGMEGANGHEGAPGQPGRNGHRGYGSPGAPGPAGRPGGVGRAGRDGEHEMPGTPGAAGNPGKPGNSGRNGVDGHPGSPGAAGGHGVDAGYCKCPTRGKSDEFSNYKTAPASPTYPSNSFSTTPTSDSLPTDWRRKKKIRVSA